MNYKHGKYSQDNQYYCIDCGKNVSNYKVKRCRDCYNILRKKQIIKYYCKKCDKELKNNTGKTGYCHSCALFEYNRLNPTKHNWYIDGRSKKPNQCVDCGKEISRLAKKCVQCANTGENNFGYNPERHKVYYCKNIDCNNEICYDTWYGGKGMCQLCCRLGYKAPKTTKKLMSLSHGGTGIPYENKDYPGEFSPKLKQKIKKRDNYTCQGCGMTQEEHFEKYNRDIEVHHIDYNRYNLKNNNLITLCKKCNISAN